MKRIDYKVPKSTFADIPYEGEIVALVAQYSNFFTDYGKNMEYVIIGDAYPQDLLSSWGYGFFMPKKGTIRAQSDFYDLYVSIFSH